MSIFDLYESLCKFLSVKERVEYDNLFYNAPEGEAQFDIVREIFEKILGGM